uniref:Uncharacterized protein n=1 Tax=Clytia hemisphaerica TaxID=252671 RepID=A0A7M5XCH3_9CNID
MATKNQNQQVIMALDLCRQLHTWDSKLHKDVFLRHLRNNLDQSRLSMTERAQVLNIMENIMYVVTDKKRYVSIEETIRDNDQAAIQDRTVESMEKIYNLKAMKPSGHYRDDWKSFHHGKEISDELLQLKIRLHEEIMVVKNDIKLCKDFIKINFEDPLTSRSLTSRIARRNSTMAEQTKKLGYNSNSARSAPSSAKSKKATIPRSHSSSSLNTNGKIKASVRRRGSTTSLLEELHQSEIRPEVCVLLGDSTLDMISQKRLVSDTTKRVESFCKSHYTIETAFEKLTDFVIENPNTDITSVCILVGANNLEQRTASPSELALVMLNSIRNLLKRISGQVFVYALLPRLDNASMDRNASHFNTQLASGLFQARLQRVVFQQNIIQREAKLYHSDGRTLAGAGLNKLMRSVRKSMANER